MSLKAENVSLALGDGAQQVQALDNVACYCVLGDLMAVLGPSGAGKSSLLNLILQLQNPTAGHICVGAANIAMLRLLVKQTR